MKVRPTSVTVITWILIVTGVLSLVTVTLTLNNPTTKELMARSPIPIPVQYVMMYVGILVSIISGIAMLKGQNWARFLYVIWGAVGFLVGVTTSPMKLMMLPGFVLFLVVVFFLFRLKANQYFTATEITDGPQNN